MKIPMVCLGFLVSFSVADAVGARNAALDQVGYRPQAAKYVFVTSAADSFRIIDPASGTVRFLGPLAIWNASDPATGKTVRRGDFTSFLQQGDYRVITSAGDSSEVFSISDTVYRQAYRKALKGFYFQRCGTSLPLQYACPYQHSLCHTQDGFFHSSTDSTGSRSAGGGWHDAGDYGKYVVNAGVSVGTLLMGYEYFPARFGQDDLTIPESGNGIPDILDEVRYEIEWLLKMQRQDGGVYFKLTRMQFEGFVMPQGDTETRYLYQVASTATADFAAMMARAARVYQPFDVTFAQRCRSAAMLAWSFLAAHPAIVPTGGFRNPSGTATGEYGDTDDSDERLWAAAELFVTTGAAEYQTYYQSNYALRSIFGFSMSWQDVRSLAHLTYMKSQQTGTNESIRQQLRNALNTYCAGQVIKRNSSGYQVALQPGEYYWGSNSVALNAAILLLFGYAEFATQSFLDAGADQLHYVLGANAHSLSFVTGVGKRSTRQPHHRPSASDGVAEPVPGLLAGGPDQNRDDPVLLSLFTSSTPPALCYVDSMPSYASNEIAINWNAPLVFVLGVLHSSSVTSVPESHGAILPSGILLRQNFPNPFNSMTQLHFTLDSEDRIELVVVDVLGRTVVREQLGTFPSGENTYRWHAVSGAGLSLSSGVYICYLQGRHQSEMRKLVLLR
jgi:endoglucanase